MFTKTPHIVSTSPVILSDAGFVDFFSGVCRQFTNLNFYFQLKFQDILKKLKFEKLKFFRFVATTEVRSDIILTICVYYFENLVVFGQFCL